MSRLIVPTFVLSLLFVQVAGVHLHVDVGHGGSDFVHGVHVEQAFSSHHVNDDGHVDVDVNDTAANPLLKVAFLAASASIVPFLDLGIRLSIVHLPQDEHSKRQHVRLRPPLRAPPTQA
ncbi:MAG: hypothetical protein ACI9ON_004053 [Limisphaerales bacterium]|jgi:hypothetical protein